MKIRNMQTMEDKEINLDDFKCIDNYYKNYKCVDDFYVIYPDGFIHFNQYAQPIKNILYLKSIGNYFETEEAKKAVEKLKAWKRLKDKGFSLSAVVDKFFCLDIYMSGEPYEEIKEDLKNSFWR